MRGLEMTGPGFEAEKHDPLFVVIGGEQIALYCRPTDLALFAFLGAVVSDAQTFEFQVGSILESLVGKAPDKTEDTSLDQYTDKTIGWLANALRKYCKDSRTAELLDRARTARNYVIHKVLKDFGWWFMSDSEYIQCLRKIREARNSIWDAQEGLREYLNSSGQLNTLAVPESEVLELRRSWERGLITRDEFESRFAALFEDP